MDLYENLYAYQYMSLKLMLDKTFIGCGDIQSFLDMQTEVDQKSIS